MATEEQLPTTSEDMVKQCRDEYDSVFRSGTREEVEAARFRLVWALVHSVQKNHVQWGYDLSTAWLQQTSSAAKDTREYRYFKAVACYKLGKYVEARRELAQLLLEEPAFRQAEFLRGCVEDSIVKEGLLGVGVVAGVAGIAGMVLAVALSARKR